MAITVKSIRTLDTVNTVPQNSKIILQKSDGDLVRMDASDLVNSSESMKSAYIVGTLYAVDWLSDSNGGVELTPEAGTIYKIKTPGNYYNSLYEWDGTRYVLVSEINALQRGATYAVGDVVHSPSLPSWAVLECVTAGTSGSTEPSFSNIDGGSGATPTLQEQIDGIDDKVPFALGNVGSVYGYYKQGENTLTPFDSSDSLDVITSDDIETMWND